MRGRGGEGRVSVRRLSAARTASCAAPPLTGWPAMGMDIAMPSVVTPGRPWQQQQCRGMRRKARIASEGAKRFRVGKALPNIAALKRKLGQALVSHALGKICFSRAAAVCAFGLPPLTQSSNVNSVCRTGLENDTLPLSTKVMCRTPHPWRGRVRHQGVAEKVAGGRQQGGALFVPAGREQRCSPGCQSREAGTLCRPQAAGPPRA